MFHIDPRLTAVFILFFFALGLYTIYTGIKLSKKERVRDPKARWYTNVRALTGIEYTLLAIVLAVNLGITVGFFPVSFSIIVVPFYYLVLLLAAGIMFLIIFQSIFVTNRRRREAAQKIRAANEARVVTPNHQSETAKAYPSAEQLAHKRDRRRKAAAARRRQSGRA